MHSTYNFPISSPTSKEITCLFVRRVRTVHIAVAAPPPRHAVAVAAGKFILAVALVDGAVVLVAAVPAVVLLIAQPPLLDALAVGASELGGSARLIWRS